MNQPQSLAVESLGQRWFGSDIDNLNSDLIANHIKLDPNAKQSSEVDSFHMDSVRDALDPTLTTLNQIF